MNYYLRRADGVYGDSGPMCQILDPKEGYHPIPNETYPRVGCGVRVGSYIARTYSMQDYWQTTPITEILEEWTDADCRGVKFKTKSNSIYIWREF
jgi:hypothetical protein